MSDVKFVSYNGEYPNLCSGKLVLEAGGIEYVFPSFCLMSGGGMSSDYEEIYDGPWSVREWPPDFPDKFKHDATKVINDNIRLGCCGGCI